MQSKDERSVLSEHLSTDRRSGSEIAKSRGAKAVGSLQSKDERPNSANASLRIGVQGVR
ncbi:hypothetical protein LEP1GSC187_0932 [Leptospira santarosai str. ZUN179]|uniref:Uncharacterized protein n=1 Tax=Leptospira santarosai str. ZUN179 TaxID=1049985 RepID=M6UMK8_9LEPT|nr:hypothetical protein LEP1GSC187_0932 [Leptospira santarosai str. ZUN179]